MKEKRVHFFKYFIVRRKFEFYLSFSVLNKLSEYVYTSTYQKALLYTVLLLVFKIAEILHCTLKVGLSPSKETVSFDSFKALLK